VKGRRNEPNRATAQDQCHVFSACPYSSVPSRRVSRVFSRKHSRLPLILNIVTPQTVTLIASILSLVGSLLVLLVGTRLALRNERRQLLWSKELERLFALEEFAGQLVEELASHRNVDPSIDGPRLGKFREAAGRFARYHDVRRAILQLQNTLERMFAAKRDRNDDEEQIRSELDRDLKKLLSACDQVTGRDKLHRGSLMLL